MSGPNGWRRSFMTHFTGCQHYSDNYNNMYSGETCTSPTKLQKPRRLDLLGLSTGGWQREAWHRWFDKRQTKGEEEEANDGGSKEGGGSQGGRRVVADKRQGSNDTVGASGEEVNSEGIEEATTSALGVGEAVVAWGWEWRRKPDDNEEVEDLTGIAILCR
ncbi:hypothetical protein B296_00005690 [Ensete ventricosum]|uniref:Uncharacterized protein n=1 Tax=Ensete ventricosum TaxID=4639 RepID=A0A426ZLJ9_ENSVE|nr:hypothetical protein B296_00005690 [Ensete ventricosum]